MMLKKHLARISFAAFLSAAVFGGTAQAWQNDRPAAPDNTRANAQDRDQSQPTADQGKNNLSDRQLAAHIRRDVVKDKSLSSYGHNVKIISEHGKVTLKGPVHSEDEKRAIEDHARKYAHDGDIDDQLTVKGDQK